MTNKSWLKNFLGLEIEDEFDEEEFEEFEQENIKENKFEKEQKSKFSTKNKSKEKNTNMNIKSNSKVILTEPEFFNDASAICDNLKNSKTVVVNLENADYEEGRNIFYFLSGAIYALDGTLQKISENVFILAPQNVDIMTNNDFDLNSNDLLNWDNND